MLTVTCRCGVEFQTYPSKLAQGRGKHCSQKCRDASRREIALASASLYLTSKALHVLQPLGGCSPEHRLVLYAKIGPGPHPCYWCGERVDWLPNAVTAPGTIVVDHLDDNKKNNAPENLVPSCHRCNCTRGRTDLVADDEPYVLMKGRNGKYQRHRAIVRFCRGCNDEFLWLAADKRPNKGLYCSRLCYYASRRK